MQYKIVIYESLGANFHTLFIEDLAGESILLKVKDVLTIISKRVEKVIFHDATIIEQRTNSLTIKPESNVIRIDRKSTRLNSSHVAISYAVFCLKKKKRQ